MYLPVSLNEFQAKGQPLDQIQQNKLQQFKHNHSLVETYPIIQHTDVTLNTNATQPFTQSNQDTNFAVLMNIKKFLLPAMNDF